MKSPKLIPALWLAFIAGCAPQPAPDCQAVRAELRRAEQERDQLRDLLHQLQGSVLEPRTPTKNPTQ